MHLNNNMLLFKMITLWNIVVEYDCDWLSVASNKVDNAKDIQNIL